MVDIKFDEEKLKRDLEFSAPLIEEERKMDAAFLDAELEHLRREAYRQQKFPGRQGQPSKQFAKRIEFIREMMAEIKSRKPAAVASHATVAHLERARELWGSEGLLEGKILNFVNNHKKKFDSYR